MHGVGQPPVAFQIPQPLQAEQDDENVGLPELIFVFYLLQGLRFLYEAGTFVAEDVILPLRDPRCIEDPHELMIPICNERAFGIKGWLALIFCIAALVRSLDVLRNAPADRIPLGDLAIYLGIALALLTLT